MAKSRGNREGSICQRKNGIWVGAISLGNGKRKVFCGSTRTAVRDEMTKLMHEKKQGTLPTGRSQTVEKYLESRLADLVKPSVRPRTYEVYGLKVRRILPHLGKLKLEKVTPAAVQKCYGALLEGGLSRRSVEQAHAVLH